MIARGSTVGGSEKATGELLIFADKDHPGARGNERLRMSERGTYTPKQRNKR